MIVKSSVWWNEDGSKKRFRVPRAEDRGGVTPHPSNLSKFGTFSYCFDDWIGKLCKDDELRLKM